MTESMLLDQFRAALTTVGMVAAPFVVAALAVGLVASLIQAATQLNEAALSFVPKIAAVGVVLALAGPWLLHELTAYTKNTTETLMRLGQERPR